MFSLIIQVIAIALGIALAVASLYYAGSAFTQAGGRAAASGLTNQAQQISAGWILWENDHGGSPPSAITDMVPDYLQSIPAPNKTALTDGSTAAYAMVDTDADTVFDSVQLADVNSEVCLRLVTSIDPNATAIGTALDTTRAYDCFAEGGINKFTFRVH